MSHMIVQYGRVPCNSNYSGHNKGDIIAAEKVVASLSILMQITARAKAVNGFP
jgi:hypothetical protein